MSRYYSGVGSFHVEGKDAVLTGVNGFDGGVYNSLKVRGANYIDSSVKVNILEVDGVCNANGKILADEALVRGILNANGTLRSHGLKIYGVLNGGKTPLEADKILCKGAIHTKGEINADEVEVYGIISCKDLYGDRIVIHTENGGYQILSGIKGLLKGNKRENISSVKNIEATDIDLLYVDADSVSGTNITIGKGCHIECVDCSGTLKIHPEAVVKAIMGTYKRCEDQPMEAKNEDVNEPTEEKAEETVNSQKEDISEKDFVEE